MKAKVFVISHKDYWMPSDRMYSPLQVGINREKIDGFLQDNLGDNIADKNASFCELTALYWIWKNYKENVEYVGLCHYRRYFGKHKILFGSFEKRANMIYSSDELSPLFQNVDIILPKKRNYFIETVESQYNHAHNPKDLLLLRDSIKKLYPTYLHDFDEHMKCRKTHIYNMFIMKRSLFDNYCKWLFDILFDLEGSIDITDYDTYQQRVFGFLSERLLDVWLSHQNLVIKEVPVVELEKTNYLLKGVNLIIRKLRSRFSF